ADVGQLLQDRVEDAPAFLLVLHLATAEEDVDQDLVVVLQELPRLVDLGLDVVLPRLGADADLLELLLPDLAALLALLRILETQLAVVEDAADRRPLIRRHLDQVEVGLPGTLQGLCGRHDVQLFPIGANQAYGGDANLLVDSWPTVRRRLTIEM